MKLKFEGLDKEKWKARYFLTANVTISKLDKITNIQVGSTIIYLTEIIAGIEYRDIEGIERDDVPDRQLQCVKISKMILADFKLKNSMVLVRIKTFLGAEWESYIKPEGAPDLFINVE